MGIKEAYIFAENVQRLNEEKLKICVENSRNFGKISGDPSANFIKCYKALIEDITKAQDQLKLEFSNYI